MDLYMHSLSDIIRIAAKKGEIHEEFISAWKKVDSSERDVLKKYAQMLLKKLKDEPFPENEKKILRKHAKGFIRFINSL